MLRQVCVMVLVAASLACAQEPESPAKRIVELARQLAGKPNDASLHAKLAIAYFERGAAGDAARVQAHSSRAIALDPGIEEELTQSLNTAQAGTELDGGTSEGELADMQAAATLPAAGTSRSDAAIRSKLAARLSRTRFAPPSTKYSKNVEVVEKLYDPATDTEPMSWSDREGELRRGLTSPSDPLTRRFIENLRRMMKARADAQARRRSEPNADDPPDVMLTKGQAYLSYVDGDVDEAVKLLKSTAAAADTLSKRALEGMSKIEDERISAAPRLAGTVRGNAVGAPVNGAPVDDDWGDDSVAERARVSTPRRTRTAAITAPDDFDGPRRDDGGAPDRNDPLTPSRTDDATPDRTQTPPRSQGTTPDRTQTPPRSDPTAPDRTGTPARTDATTPDRTATPARTDASTPDRTATPARTDPTAPPRTDTPTRTDPPPPSAPPPAPPEALRRIGQQALEGLEATRTGEVPPPEVTTKLRELAQTAEVGEPLVVDLDGDGVPSVPGGLAPDGRVEPDASVRFDIDGDGHVDVVEWIHAGDALICADVDGDGLITSGRELPGALPGHGDSIAWLERRDIDSDGALTGRELAGISLWKDNGDARVQPGELVSADAAHLTRIQIHGPRGCRAVVAGADRAAWEWWPDQGASKVAAASDPSESKESASSQAGPPAAALSQARTGSTAGIHRP